MKKVKVPKLVVMKDAPMYIVLEHHRLASVPDSKVKKVADAIFHGIYVKKENAERKREKIQKLAKHGYVCVLKKRIVDLKQNSRPVTIKATQ